MGLAEQERALLALVFDGQVRARYHEDPAATLSALGVPVHEHADLLPLSHFGLDVDARDRALLVLGRLAGSFPMTVSALSAFPGALDRVRALVSLEHFSVPVAARPPRFGAGLRACVEELPGPSRGERSLLRALAEWETALATVAAEARAAAARGELHEEEAGAHEPPEGWEQRPLRLAPHVTLARFPVSVAWLEKVLVPCARDHVWAQLSREPLPRERLTQALTSQGEGHLVLGRAVVHRASPTDPEVTLRELELSAGFAAFLGRLDGRASAESLLAQFRQAGATGQVVAGVRDGLLRLVRERALQLS